MTELGRAVATVDVAIPGDTDARITLSWAAVTDVGLRRHHNEDSFLAEPPMFVVADGMGGHSAGDVASAAVVARMREAGQAGFAEQTAILHGLREATDDITRAEDAAGLGVGTTATGVALTLQNGEPRWSVFNIGDSRVYRFSGQTLSRVTTDHSVVQELVDAGLIRAEDAEFHPDSNVITRAVGFNAEPRPDWWVLPVTAGTRILVCSDGLTREADDATLAYHLGSGSTASETAAALVSAALRRGGRDNVTAIVIDVVSAPILDDGDDFDLESTVPKGGVQVS